MVNGICLEYNDVEKFVKDRLFFTEIRHGFNSSDFNGKQGIIVFGSCEWASGNGAHIDLFNGTKVESKDYSTRCGKVTLYVLE